MMSAQMMVSGWFACTPDVGPPACGVMPALHLSCMRLAHRIRDAHPCVRSAAPIAVLAWGRFRAAAGVPAAAAAAGAVAPPLWA